MRNIRELVEDNLATWNLRHKIGRVEKGAARFFDGALLGRHRLAADDYEFDVVSLDDLTVSKRSYAG